MTPIVVPAASQGQDGTGGDAAATVTSGPGSWHLPAVGRHSSITSPATPLVPATDLSVMLKFSITGEVTGTHICASTVLAPPPATAHLPAWSSACLIAHFFFLLGSPGKDKTALSQVRAHTWDSPLYGRKLQISSPEFSTDSDVTQSHSPLTSVFLTQG